MLIKLASTDLKGQSLTQVTEELCESQKWVIGKASPDLKLEMTQCCRHHFTNQRYARIFLRNLFTLLTGLHPPDNAISVPVLQVITELA